MIADNHFYSRGYQIVKSKEGNHRPPVSLSQGSGYSTVGASKGLDLSKIDMLESSSFMDFNAKSGVQLRSLYLYPRFCELKGRSFALLGQATTHENNFSDSRPNYFVHNIIIGLKDFKLLIEMRDPLTFLDYPYKDTYVDAQNGLVKENELAYQNCITPKVDIVSDYGVHGKINNNLCVPIDENLAKAIIVGLLKKKCCTICVSDDPTLVDTEARKILFSLYKWLPVKLLLTLGFITCLNSSQSHKTCNLIFCDKSEYSTIRNSGVGSINPSDMYFVDATQLKGQIYSVEKISEPVCAYINWMAKCMSGNYNSHDENILKKIDAFELDIQQRNFNMGFSSYVYEYVSALEKNCGLINSDIDYKVFNIFASALKMYSNNSLKDVNLKKISQNMVDSIERVVLSGNVDNVISEIESKNSNAFDIVLPMFSAEFKDHIYSLKIYNSSLKDLYGMCNKATDNDLIKIVNGAKSKIDSLKYAKNDIIFGYKIASISLFKAPFNKDKSNFEASKSLAKSVLIAAKKNNINLYSDITNLSGFMEALYVYNISEGRVTCELCESIISNLSLKRAERPIISFRRLVDSNREAELRIWNNAIIMPVLEYTFKLCIENDYDFDNSIDPFVKLIAKREEYKLVWNKLVDLSSDMFNYSVATKDNSYKVLQYLCSSVFNDNIHKKNNEKNRSYKSKLESDFINDYISRFIKEITPAFTILFILNGYNNAMPVVTSIYKEIIKGFNRGYISDSAKLFKDTMMKNEITSVGDYKLDVSDVKKYKSLQNREKASCIESWAETAGLKDSDDYKAFFAYLDVKPLPNYAKCNGSDYDVALDNIYRAFDGEEERPEMIEKCLSDLSKKFDICRIGVFSNTSKATVLSLFELINQRRSDTDLYKSFFNFLKENISEKKLELDLSNEPSLKCYEKYFNMMANMAAYNIDMYIDISDITNYNISSVHQITLTRNVIISLVKYIDNLQNDINDIINEQGCARFLNYTENVRDLLDKELVEKLENTDVFQVMSDFLSYNLESVLCFFPLTVKYIAEKIKSADADQYKSSQKNLILKIRQINGMDYCTDEYVNDILNEYVHKNQEIGNRNKTKIVISVAACLTVVLLGIVGFILAVNEHKNISSDYTIETYYTYNQIGSEDEKYDILNVSNTNLYQVTQNKEKVVSPVDVIEYESFFDDIFHVSNTDIDDLHDSRYIISNPDYCFGKNHNKAIIEIVWLYKVNVEFEVIGAVKSEYISSPYNINYKKYYVDVKDGKYNIPEEDINEIFESNSNKNDLNVYIRVYTKFDAEAEINGIRYPTFVEAWSEVEDGDTINLKKDVNVEETLNVDKNITIYAEGHRLLRSDNLKSAIINVQENKNIEIHSAIIDGNGSEKVNERLLDAYSIDENSKKTFDNTSVTTTTTKSLSNNHSSTTSSSTISSSTTSSGKTSSSTTTTTVHKDVSVGNSESTEPQGVVKLEFKPLEELLVGSEKNVKLSFKVYNKTSEILNEIKFNLNFSANIKLDVLEKRFISSDSCVTLGSPDLNKSLIPVTCRFNEPLAVAKSKEFSIEFNTGACDNAVIDFSISKTTTSIDNITFDFDSSCVRRLTIDDAWYNARITEIIVFDQNNNQIKLEPYENSKYYEHDNLEFQPIIRDYLVNVDSDISKLNIVCKVSGLSGNNITFDSEPIIEKLKMCKMTLRDSSNPNSTYTLRVKIKSTGNDDEKTKITVASSPIVFNRGNIRLDNVIFKNNFNDTNNGAGAIQNEATAELKNCTVINNYGNYVGAIRNGENGRLDLIGSNTIKCNIGNYYGGIYNDKKSKVTIKDGTIYINENILNNKKPSNLYISNKITIFGNVLSDSESYIGFITDGKVIDIAEIQELSKDNKLGNINTIFKADDDNIIVEGISDDSSKITVRYKE